MGRKDLRPVFEKARPGDVRNSTADISRSIGIGFIPGYHLREGLRETIMALRSDNGSRQFAELGKL